MPGSTSRASVSAMEDGLESPYAFRGPWADAPIGLTPPAGRLSHFPKVPGKRERLRSDQTPAIRPKSSLSRFRRLGGGNERGARQGE